MKKDTFKQIVSHLWEHRFYFNEHSEFDYPFYGGLSGKIVNKLSSEGCDAMQNIWHLFIEGEFKTKKCFASAYKKELKGVGELIK